MDHSLNNNRLEASFYERNARIVAQELLGKKLVHHIAGELISGIIVETEAYCDFRVPDLACHGSRNKGRPTKRTTVMFGPPGHVYVYLNYGIHWLFNVVTGKAGTPSAVLVRALEPVSGLDFMVQSRAKSDLKNLTNGPGKLTQALAINQSYYGQNLCAANSVIWIEDTAEVAPNQLCCGPRIGLGKTPEPWHSMPWRFWIKNNKYVSV
ncbi:MAG: DNA-3-methyladenine glycosylase [Chloroflexota bacterium]